MPVVTYNGITLPFQRTVRADERVVYSDDGTDALHVRREYTFETTISAEIPDLVNQGETWADCCRRITAFLEQPRKKLSIDWGGDALIVVAPSDDRHHGPLPQGVSYTSMVGTSAGTLQFSITCHTPACLDRSRNPPWLSNRWTEKLVIDPSDFRRRWSRQGKLVVRPPDPAAENWHADDWRQVVIPPVRWGYLRTTPPILELSSDGLTLAYQVEDEEQYAMPPAGAITADGHCAVAAHHGQFRYAEVAVKLTGGVDQPKWFLLQEAVVVAVQKLEDMGVKRDPATRTLPITTGTMRTRLWKNEVDVYLRAVCTPHRGVGAVAGEWVRQKGQQVVGAALGAVFGPFLGPNNTFVLVKGLFEQLQDRPADEPRWAAGAVAGGALGVWLPKALNPPFGMTIKPWGYSSPPPQPGVAPDLDLVAARLQDPCQAPPRVGGLPGYGRGVEVPPVSPGRVLPNSVQQFNRLAETNPLVRLLFPNGAASPVPVVTRADQDGSPPIGFGGSLSNLSDQREQSLSVLYTDYRLRQRRVTDEGLTAMPEQRAGGVCRFVPVSGRSVKLVVEWTAERVGQPPDVPPRDMADKNYVFLWGEEGLPEWNVGEDGVTGLFRSSGQYVFGIVDPAKGHDGVSIAPWAADLLGREPKPIVGPMGPDGYDTKTGVGTGLDKLRSWRDQPPPKPPPQG